MTGKLIEISTYATPRSQTLGMDGTGYRDILSYDYEYEKYVYVKDSETFSE